MRFPGNDVGTEGNILVSCSISVYHQKNILRGEKNGFVHIKSFVYNCFTVTLDLFIWLQGTLKMVVGKVKVNRIKSCNRNRSNLL